METRSGVELIWQAPGFGERILLMEMRQGKLIIGTTAGVYEMNDSGAVEKIGTEPDGGKHGQ